MVSIARATPDFPSKWSTRPHLVKAAGRRLDAVTWYYVAFRPPARLRCLSDLPRP